MAGIGGRGLHPLASTFRGATRDAIEAAEMTSGRVVPGMLFSQETSIAFLAVNHGRRSAGVYGALGSYFSDYRHRLASAIGFECRGKHPMVEGCLLRRGAIEWLAHMVVAVRELVTEGGQHL